MGNNILNADEKDKFARYDIVKSPLIHMPDYDLEQMICLWCVYNIDFLSDAVRTDVMQSSLSSESLRNCEIFVSAVEALKEKYRDREQLEEKKDKTE